MKKVFRGVVALAIGLSVAPGARADDIGRIKVARGQVSIERGSASLPAAVGAGLQPADVVVTGNDGSVGITMSDDTLLSAGANSRLSFDQ